MMTHVSFFTGIGGIDLAAEWQGFQTILQVKKDMARLARLRTLWPGMPRVHNIHDTRAITRKALRYGPVTVISGGFPCQPYSAAGKRRGREDDRYLWPPMRDAISAIHPRWVVAENVSGLLFIEHGMVFESVCADLEAEGYEVIPLHYPAAGVGAWHLRYRVFIVAHDADADSNVDGIRFERERQREQSREPAPAEPREIREAAADAESASGGTRFRDIESEAQRRVQPGNGIRNVPDADVGKDRGLHDRWQIAETAAFAAGNRAAHRYSRRERVEGWIPTTPDHRPEIRGRLRHWAVEPNLARVAYGIPDRVDRISGIGAAVVPQQVEPIFEAIAATEAACR